MRFRALTTLLLAAVCGAIPAAAPSAQQKGTGQNSGQSSGQINCILELYTSQGCSSCPPADQLLKSYLGRDDVLALSFNVDIWDNLGWKDTLAKPQFTLRQRLYARTRGDGNVYTPQTIVNGESHAVGSDKRGIDALIRATETQRQRARLELAVRPDGDDVVVDVPATGGPRGDATLWLVKFTPRVEVPIARGENAGRTIAYHNVVRDMRSVGTFGGDAKSARLAREVLAGCVPGTCALLLQQGATGGMLGAAWVPRLNGI